MKNQLKRTTVRAIRSLVAMMMVLCLMMGTVSVAFAAKSVGATPDYVSPSAAKTYIKLSAAVPFFTGVTSGTGTVITPVAGTVCQLVSPDWYTASDGKAYYSVYYLSQRYNVLKSAVEKDIMTEEALNAYITGTLWKQTTYTTLRKNMNLVGDVRVHAVQLALQKLGYYDGELDGGYGNETHNAVYKFQKANKLDPDGSAGPMTQPILFALASGTGTGTTSGSIGTTVTTPSTGTLRTIATVNLRKYGSASSSRLASVPKNINLSYTDVYTASNGVNWFQVRYAGETGWIMGTYVKVTSGSTSSGSTSGSTSSGSTSSGTANAIGTLKATSQVNLRKYASTGSARLGIVPKGTSLSYTDTYVDSKNVTWYEVRYNGETGWVMGTFVTVNGVSGSTGSGSTSGSVSIGTVTITKPGTRVRESANGSKTGYVLSNGSVVDLLAQPVAVAGYTWYNIRTSSGLIGWVRGDCATASIGSGSGSLTVSANKTFIKLPAKTVLFKTETKPASGGISVAAGTVLMMYSTDTYTVDNVKYCTLYYDNEKYNAVYSEVSGGIMTTEAVSAYVKTLLASALPSTLKRELDLVGDVRVYALQVALNSLNYYTGKLDGDYGAGTQSAVRNFQRAAKIEVDGACGNDTWKALNAKLNGSTSTGTTVTGFGAVTSVEKASWDYDNAGIDLIPKNSYATIMDVATGKCFQIYRWSGASHADCVPATAADTKIMCEIVGFPYNSNHPNSTQLSKIKADGNNGSPTYTWPDFNNAFGGAKDIGSAWDARAALLNVNGKVYPVGIYGFPHGFTGTDSFSSSKYQGGVSNGMYFYAASNYYGMMCLHFVGSKTHSGNVSSDRQNAINTAWEYAKKTWPDLCK